MFKIRGGIAVIIATVIGVILLIVAVSKAQDAFAITTVAKEDIFTITGKARFYEKAEESMYRPNKYVFVSVDSYPATFKIGKKSSSQTAASFEAALDTAAVVRITIPKSALALLYTGSTIQVYELANGKGQTLLSFAAATKRDSADRLNLYLQAALCFLGALVLLIFPKKYLLKD